MVESVVNMHDRNVSQEKNFRILFVNYRSLGGIGQPVWGPRRLSEYELILSLRGEFEFLNCETGERARQRPGEILTIRPGEEHLYRAALFTHFFPHGKVGNILALLRRSQGAEQPQRTLRLDAAPAAAHFSSCFSKISCTFGKFARSYPGNLEAR